MLARRFLIIGAAVALRLASAKTAVLLPLYEYSEDCWPELQTAACVSSLSTSPRPRSAS